MPQGPHLGARRLPSPSERTLATTTYRVITTVLAALAVVGQVVHIRALVLGAAGTGPLSGGARPSIVAVVGAGAVVSAMAALTSIVVTLHARRERGAQPIGVALAAWAYLLAYSGVVLLLAPRVAGGARTLFDAHFLVVEALGLAGLLAFSSRFPRGLGAGDLQAPGTLPVGIATAQRLRALLLAPAAPWITAALAVAILLGLNGALGRPTSEAALLPLADLLRVSALAVVVLNLRRGYLLADSDGRARAQWMALGFVVLVGTAGLVVGSNILSAVTGWETQRVNWRPMVLDAGVLGLLWGLSRGVLHEGPGSAAGLVPRVGLLAIAATGALLLAAGLEAFFAGALPGRLFLPAGLGTVVAFVTVGTLYARLRAPFELALARSWRSAGVPEPTA